MLTQSGASGCVIGSEGSSFSQQPTIVNITFHFCHLLIYYYPSTWMCPFDSMISFGC